MVSVRAYNPNVFYYIRALETSLKQVEYVISITEMITANVSWLSTSVMPIESRLMDLSPSQESLCHLKDWPWPSWEFQQFLEEPEPPLLQRLPRHTTLLPSGKPPQHGTRWIDSHLEPKPLIWIDSRSWSTESKEAMMLESSLASRNQRQRDQHQLKQLQQPRVQRAKERSENWLKVVIQSDKHRACYHSHCTWLTRRVLYVNTRYYLL